MCGYTVYAMRPNAYVARELTPEIRRVIGRATTIGEVKLVSHYIQGARY